MKNLTALLLAAAVAISCDRGLTAPPAPEQPAAFPLTTAQDVALASRSRLADEEKAAFNNVMAHFSAENKEYIKQQLAVPGRRIELPNDRIGQKLIDTYYAKRAEHGKASEIAVVPATLALVDKMPSKDAVAVIIRRPGVGDTILLTDATASVESLGSAITALYAVRARDGDSPSTNTRLTVENAVMPQHWKDGLDQKAAKTISDLKHAAKRNVAGIGDARTTSVLLVGH